MFLKIYNSNYRIVMLFCFLIIFPAWLKVQANDGVPTYKHAMEAALLDFRAGHELPGLPDLAKPVFVAPKSLACSSSATLINPNIEDTLRTGACVITNKKIKITVFPPQNANEYITDHVFKIVAVGLRSGEMSNGNVSVFFVRIDALKN